jgi:hypothetical protein
MTTEAAVSEVLKGGDCREENAPPWKRYNSGLI